MDKLTELIIRQALLRHLRKSSKVRVLEELKIEGGAARIDVATIGREIVGFEIKSDFDNFDRMSNQIHAYNRVFTKINLVCGVRHLEYAEAVLPSWWGLYRVEVRDGKTEVVRVRAARRHDSQDAYSLASLLDKQEAIALLRARHYSIQKAANLREVWSAMADAIPLREIEEAVIQNFESPVNQKIACPLFGTA